MSAHAQTTVWLAPSATSFSCLCEPCLESARQSGAIFSDAGLAFVLSPVVAIVLLMVALVMTTRSLEEILNPRLRNG